MYFPHSFFSPVSGFGQTRSICCRICQKKHFHNWYFLKCLSKIASQCPWRQKSSLQQYNRYRADISHIPFFLSSIRPELETCWCWLCSSLCFSPPFWDAQQGHDVAFRGLFFDPWRATVFSATSQCSLVRLWLECGWRNSEEYLRTVGHWTELKFILFPPKRKSWKSPVRWPGPFVLIFNHPAAETLLRGATVFCRGYQLYVIPSGLFWTSLPRNERCCCTASLSLHSPHPTLLTANEVFPQTFSSYRSVPC